MTQPITAQAVRDRKEASGAAMIDCKHALRACDGNFEAALRHLRDKPDEEDPEPEDA